MNWTVRMGSLLVVLLLMVLAGCGAQEVIVDQDGPIKEGVTPLRVGMAANSPPMVYKSGAGNLQGLEVELARRVGRELNRPVVFVLMDFDRLIPAVESGRIDVVMSGMTITPDREQKVLFTATYLKTGQSALVRMEDRFNFYLPPSILQFKGWVGTERNTTGDAFAKRYMPNASVWGYSSVPDAAVALVSRKVGMVIGDMPIILWLANNSGGECYAVTTMLTTEFLGWAVRKDNTALKSQLDQLIFKWQSDGSLYTLINDWLPGRSQ